MTLRLLLLQSAGTSHLGGRGIWNEIGDEIETGKLNSAVIPGTGGLSMISALMEKIGKLWINQVYLFAKYFIFR